MLTVVILLVSSHTFTVPLSFAKIRKYDTFQRSLVRCSRIVSKLIPGNDGAPRSQSDNGREEGGHINDQWSFNSKNARQAAPERRSPLPLLFSAAHDRLPPFRSSFIHGQTAVLLGRLYCLWTLNALSPFLFNTYSINRRGNYFSNDFVGFWIKQITARAETRAGVKQSRDKREQ